MDESTGMFTELDCGCLHSAGRVGDEVWCARHRAIVLITQAAREWVAMCVTCRWTKREGLARLSAEVDAARHARRQQHRVHVMHGAEVVFEFGPQVSGQMALFRSTDVDQPRKRPSERRRRP